MDSPARLAGVDRLLEHTPQSLKVGDPGVDAGDMLARKVPDLGAGLQARFAKRDQLANGVDASSRERRMNRSLSRCSGS